ncbi:basic blue protein [Cinnamomum micranthum f. kanehirae]|uniref:Plantacyanin n=1 Tax=Cinnamomum micranthum f. kanehirae TaxID=337451 RepID=A0A3S3MNJ4_9MAGN|nr:basic blue protein [Cinnamomum micranthum f. kanehirae]
MAQAKTICMVVLFLCLVAHFNVSLCETYTVGDEKGWSYDSSPWPLNKNFKAGDVLVFNYKPVEHNVVVVNEKGYDDCTVPPGSPTFITGKDSITLAKNYNYFISSIGKDCQYDMKMMVNAD